MTTPIQTVPRSRNINIWKDAEVYTSTDNTAQIGADGTFDPAVWDFFGLLNTGSSIGQEIDVTRDDVQSFGAKLELKDVKFNKDTRTVTALEDNETNFKLLWPDSEWKDNGVSVLKAPKDAAEVVVAFKTVNSFGDVLIDISRIPAFAYASGQEKGDEGASTTEFTFEILEDEKGALYDRLRIKDDGTVTPEDVTPVRIVEQTNPEDPVNP